MTRSDTAKAVVFNGSGQPLKTMTFPLPELAPGEVLVKVLCCTLCGSDLHTHGGRRSTPTPTILGHEILGEVVDVAERQAARYLDGAPITCGDRVTWSIAANCGRCFFCQRGIPQKCRSLFKYGHEAVTERHPLSGGLAEYCHLAPGTALVRVPDGIPDEVACPANCATATIAAALRTGGFRPNGEGADQSILVQGAGMLGLTACAMASARGCEEVLVCDVDDARLAEAKRFGATRRIDVSTDEVALKASIEEATSGRGVDLALELSGSPAAMEAGIDALRIGGRYVLVGAVFPGPDLSVSPEQIIRRMLSIHGVHNYKPEDLATAVSFLALNHGRFPFAELVTKSFPLGRTEAAFEYAKKHRALRIAVKP